MDTRLFILLILSALLGLSAATTDNTTQRTDWGTITVQAEGSDALLQWTPDPAGAPERFLVQKRKEGAAFRALKQVMAGSAYRFREPAEKGTEYRVIQIDTDGKWSYSPTVQLGATSY